MKIVGIILLILLQIPNASSHDNEEDFSLPFLNQIQKYQHPSYLPVFSGKQMGEELIRGLEPQHPALQELLSLFHDVSALSLTTSPPFTRMEKIGSQGDRAQMRGLDILIERGELESGTLILADSGHDISTLGYFMKNYSHRFNIQAAFYYPIQLYMDPGNYDRIIHQTQEWNEDIAYWQKQNAAKGLPDIIYIALEAHRENYDDTYLYEVPFRLLPTAEQLQNLNIDKVIYLTEAHPDSPESVALSKLRRDIKKYISTLKLEVKYLGNDCRRDGSKGLCATDKVL